MGDRNSGAGFAIGFTLGAVIGLAIGFLLAPQPGEETRKLLKDKTTDITEKAREISTDREKRYKQTWKKRKEQSSASP